MIYNDDLAVNKKAVVALVWPTASQAKRRGFEPGLAAPVRTQLTVKARLAVSQTQSCPKS